MNRLSVLLIALLLATTAAARVDVYEFDDPDKEARYNKLIGELRCLVCQNQNLAGSNSKLAVDLRRKTYDLVRQDKSEQEIADYMVERYGEFVLYRPPLSRNTLVLWIGPFVILALGIGLLLRTIRRRRDAQPTEVDEAKLKAAAALLETENDRRPS